MTVHLDPIALPSIAELDDGDLDRYNNALSDTMPSKMYFYLEYIQQCHILGEILATVYSHL